MEHELDLQDQLTRAVYDGVVERVEECLQAGANPDKADRKGWTPLMMAAETENLLMIEILLSHGVDVNRKGYGGQTALHMAVDSSIDGTIQTGGCPGDEPTATIERLLVAGARPSMEADNGETPIDWARNYNSTKVLEVLTRAH